MQLFGGPRVQRDFIRAQRRQRFSFDRTKWAERGLLGEVDGRDCRIGHFAAVARQRIGQVNHRRLNVEADVRDGSKPLHEFPLRRRIEHHSVGSDVPIAQRCAFDVQSIIGTVGGPRPAVLTRHKDRIDSSRLVEPLGEPIERHVRVLRRALRWAKTEGAQPSGGDDFAHRHPLRADGVPLSAQRTLGGNCIECGQSQQHGIAHSQTEPFGRGLVQHDLLRTRQPPRAAGAQLPKTLIAADQLHAVRTTRRLRIGIFQAYLQQNGGGGFPASLVGQCRPEEVARRQRLVDSPQAVERQSAEAFPHRVAHQQRSGQHRRAYRNAARHSEVRSPVVDERGEGQAERGHGYANDEIRMTNDEGSMNDG